MGNPNLSSGNKWLNNRPVMRSDPNQLIKNYHWDADDNSKFTYSNGFSGVNALVSNNNCLYDYRQFTNDTTSSFTENCNSSLLEEMWHQSDSLKNIIVQALSGENQPSVIAILNERLAEVNYKLSDLSSMALRCLEGQASQDSSILVWAIRLNGELFTYDTLSQFWAGSNFNSINNITGVSASHLSDFQVLLSASNLLASYIQDSIDIYNLKNDKLIPLVNIANESYGDYTNELRTWLNTYYNIRIDAPLENAPRASQKKENNNKSNVENSFLLIPNPTYDCFTIISKRNIMNELFEISIYDLQGHEKIKTILNSNQNLCIRGILNPSIYIVKMTTIDKNNSKIFKLVIQ